MNENNQFFRVITKGKPRMHRYMITSFVAILLMLHASSSPPADAMPRGLIKGSGYAFEISAPKGWVLDVEGGASAGRNAQLYPEKSSFSTSPTVMFVTVVSKSLPHCESVGKLAYTNESNAKKEVPNIVISRSDSVSTKYGKRAYVRLYGATQFQAVAYVDEDSTIVMFVLRSKDRSRFDNARYSLKALIGSYKWLYKKPD